MSGRPIREPESWHSDRDAAPPRVAAQCEKSGVDGGTRQANIEPVELTETGCRGPKPVCAFEPGRQRARSLIRG